MFMKDFIAYKLLPGLIGPAVAPEWRKQYVDVN